MAFELRLTFSGLTGLVPNKDVGESKPAKEWLVVMPAVKNGRHLEKGKRTFPIAPHQPALVMNAQAVRPANGEEEKKKAKTARLQFGDLHNGSTATRLLFELDRELLEIRSGTKKLEVHSKNPAKETPDLQKPDELHDIKWVPPIHECINGGVPFNRKLLSSKQRPTDALAGVVRLDRGRLEVSNVHKDLAGQAAAYRFRQGAANGTVRFTQALATSFRLRVLVASEKETLVLTNQSGDEKLLVVGPYEGCPKNEKGEPLVEIEVCNLELEKILGLGNGASAATSEKGDTDFAIFYELSSRWKQLSASDLALPYLKKPGGGGSGRPCEPPQYAGMGG